MLSAFGFATSGRPRHKRICFEHALSYAQLANSLQATCYQSGGTLQLKEMYVHSGDIDAEFRLLCKEGKLKSAINAMLRMDQQGIRPSVDMYRSVLSACSSRKALAQAQLVREHLGRVGFELTEYLGECLVDTLVKCGGIQEAVDVFQRLPNKTVASWRTVISGYSKARRVNEALEMYECMQQEGVEPGKHTLATIIKACGSMGNLEQGKRLHAEAWRLGVDSDLLVATCLIDMYAKCGSFSDAQLVFNTLSQPDVVAWTALLTAYAGQGHAEKSLVAYEQLRNEGLYPDSWIFVSVLQACSLLAAKGDSPQAELMQKGKELHAEIRRAGCESQTFVGNALISMYGRCGNVVDARNVLSKLVERDAVSWNAMLATYVQNNLAQAAMSFYAHMLEHGVPPNERTLVAMLQVCGKIAEKERDVLVDGESLKVESLQSGKAIHAEAVRGGCEVDLFVGNALVSLFGKCGSTSDADIVFQQMPWKDVVSWTAMISAYTQQGQAIKALELYTELQEEHISPDAQTLVCVVQACSSLPQDEGNFFQSGPSIKDENLQKCKAMHAEVWRRGYAFDVFLGNSLVTMYGKCGSIFDAQTVFDGLLLRDIVSWNAMLAANAQQELAQEAIELFCHMLEQCVTPDARTLVTVLQACRSLAEREESERQVSLVPLHYGKVIHAEARRLQEYDSNDFLHSALIALYGKSGSMEDARIVFDNLSQQDIISCNAMLAAYAQHGRTDDALQLYQEMLDRGFNLDGWAFVSLLHVSGLVLEREASVHVDGYLTKLELLQKVRSVHGEAWRSGSQSDVFVGSCLISMYGKCGSIQCAQDVFNGMSQQKSVVWNAMLTVYIEHRHNNKALQLFKRMQELGANVNEVTLVSILQACSKAGSFDLCQQVHQTLILSGKSLNSVLSTSLIHAYGRCASMEDAQAVFDALPQPDVVSWSTLIAGYARQGDSEATLNCYSRMQLAGVRPNSITFLSLLSACSHAGLVEKGVEYFESMGREHGLTPQIEHYVCVVDLLGRAGHLNTAELLLETMPLQPDMATWLCMLAACRKHGKVELGVKAFKHAVHLQPKHAAPYTMMVSIYADAGLWTKVKEVKELMQNAGACKDLPGQSWVGHKQDVDTFLVAECDDQENQMFRLLQVLAVEMTRDSSTLRHSTLSSGGSKLTFLGSKRRLNSSSNSCLVD